MSKMTNKDKDMKMVMISIFREKKRSNKTTSKFNNYSIIYLIDNLVITHFLKILLGGFFFGKLKCELVVNR